MPDNDLFRKRVPQAWQRAVECAFKLELPGNAVESLVAAGARELRNRGCPALAEVTDIVYAAAADVPTISCATAIDQLRQICEGHMRRVDQIAALSALSTLDVPVEMWSDESELREAVARGFVVDFVRRNAFGEGFKAELIESGAVSYRWVQEREHHIMRLLEESDALNRVARQLAEDPSGASITVPRKASNRRSQAEILALGLTPV